MGAMGTTNYEHDVAAWAAEQAGLIRAGKVDQLDLEHIADEIEDLGKSERRELASRVAVLLAHLLKWQFQPERRGKSWARTIRVQRSDVAEIIEEAPSLAPLLSDPAWLRKAWGRALIQADGETGLGDAFPEDCPWPMADVMSEGWLP
jgi:hypothetical protein